MEKSIEGGVHDREIHARVEDQQEVDWSLCPDGQFHAGKEDRKGGACVPGFLRAEEKPRLHQAIAVDGVVVGDGGELKSSGDARIGELVSDGVEGRSVASVICLSCVGDVLAKVPTRIEWGVDV